MGQYLSTSTKKLLMHILVKISTLAHRLFPSVARYILEHPIKTVLHVLATLFFTFPSVLFGPALTLVGFSSGGIAAGSTAATVQSAIGPVTAKGLFATLQSAQAGGYGFATVASAVRYATFALGAARAAEKLGRK